MTCSLPGLHGIHGTRRTMCAVVPWLALLNNEGWLNRGTRERQASRWRVSRKFSRGEPGCSTWQDRVLFSTGGDREDRRLFEIRRRDGEIGDGTYTQAKTPGYIYSAPFVFTRRPKKGLQHLISSCNSCKETRKQLASIKWHYHSLSAGYYYRWTGDFFPSYRSINNIIVNNCFVFVSHKVYPYIFNSLKIEIVRNKCNTLLGKLRYKILPCSEKREQFEKHYRIVAGIMQRWVLMQSRKL